jgi:TolB-like protein
MQAKRRMSAVAVLAFLLGMGIAGLFPGESWAASKTRVAVIDFEQKAFQEFQGKQIGEIVAEWLITSLSNTGRFEVVERAQLQKVLQEQQLGVSGMINQETAAKMGELLGVKVIVSGSVIQIGNTYDVNARLISVQDGSIIKAERIRGVGLDGVERMMDSLAETFKKEFPLEGYVVMVSGKRAMIDLGRGNGVEPGMRFFALRKGAPVRHPVTGKMLAGEDIKIGEMIVQTTEREASWAEIVYQEPGISIAAGNLAKQALGERMAVTTAPLTPLPPSPPPVTAPAPPAPTLAPPPPVVPPPKMQPPIPGRVAGNRILVEWAGMHDLLLGDRDGYVWLFLNIGSREAPRYDAGTKLRAGGKEIKVRGPSYPYLVDWNEDGKVDLLVGNGGGYLHLFLNQGDGNLSSGVMVKAGAKDLDVGSRASPCVVDWNEDGKKDLVMGNGSGEIVVFLNEGTNHQPIFSKGFKLNNGRLDVGSDSSPEAVDWNGDGKKDLVVGNDNGEVFVFINQGTNHEPQFNNEGEKLPLKLGPSIILQVLNKGRGMNDLVAADRNGEVTYFPGAGSAGAQIFPEKRVLKAAKR